MGLWNELDNHVQIPSCTCEVAKTFISMMEDDKAHQILMGLDDDLYSTVRSQILAIDPLPPMEKIFNMVQQQENHKITMLNREHEKWLHLP